MRSKKSKSIDGPRRPKNIDKKAISLEENDNFTVHHINEEDQDDLNFLEDKEHDSPVVMEEQRTGEKIKVKFENFVQLVASHNYEDVVEKNRDEEIVVSSNLLTDLANAHEQDEERRIPAIFIIGVVIGIVVTYILLKF